MHRIEIECHNVTGADRRIENCRQADQVGLAPDLAAHEKRSAAAVAPLQDHAARIEWPIEAGGAVGSAQPAAWYGVQRKILPENIAMSRIAISNRVIRSRKSDAHMSSGCARSCALCRGCRRAAAALGAAGRPTGLTPNPADDAAFDRQRRASAQGHEEATVFDEMLNLCKALPTDAAGNVVGFGGCAVAGGLRRFLKRHRTPGFGNAVNLLRELKIDVSVKEHIDLVLQVAGANVLVAQIDVWHFALIKRVAHPADRIGVRPRHPNAKARRLCRMMRHIWC